MQRLNPEQLEIDLRKISGYLLAVDHPRGRDKARFFLALGFSPKRPDELAAELRQLGSSFEAVGPIRTVHGDRYIVDGALRGAGVRTVWIVDPPGPRVRLLTAYPRRIK